MTRSRVSFFAALTMLLLGLTGPSVAPGAAQFQWNARTGAFPATGSGDRMLGSIAVTTDANTNWSLSGLPSWITVVSGSPWTGSGVATFRVANNTGVARTATISIAGSSLEIYQADGRCVTSITPSTAQISAGGASEKSFNVANPGVCFWSTQARDSWISLMSYGDTGSGSVLYAVGSSSTRRSGAIIAGSSVFIVDQNGTDGCNYLPSPLYYDFPAAGGRGSFDLFLGSNCSAWAVTSDSPWVTINKGSGTGSGTATYTVAANPTDKARQAVLIVNNQPHFVNQAPSPTPGLMDLQPGPANGQDTSWGSGYYQNGTPDDAVLTYGGSGDSFSDYFQFDLTGGFPPANVVKAELQLFVTGQAPSDPRLQLWQLTQAWSETSVKATSNPSGIVIRNLPPLQAGWNSIDVTDLYKRWATGSTPNYGVKIAPAGTPNNARGYLTSCEYSDAAKRPRIVLHYTEEPFGASLAIQQNLQVVGGNGYQELYYNYSTGSSSVSPYTYSSGAVPYEAPIGQWVGLYHYDYAAGRFSQALYSGRTAIP